jgi:hypothetical protein
MKAKRIIEISSHEFATTEEWRDAVNAQLLKLARDGALSADIEIQYQTAGNGNIVERSVLIICSVTYAPMAQ